MQRRCPPRTLWNENKSPKRAQVDLIDEVISCKPAPWTKRKRRSWLVAICTLLFVIVMATVAINSSLGYLSLPTFPTEELRQYPDTVFVGHRACDTDSLGAMIGAAALFGSPYFASCEEGLSPETQFVVNYFKIQNLQESTSAVFANKTWALIDHNELAQVQRSVSIPHIVMIIDHHVVASGTVPLRGPTRMDIRPWGSGATIVCYKFFEAQRHVPKGAVAGAMLAGILSDTFNLVGPTTTPFDKVARDYLAERAGIVDVDDFAYKMFKAKSDVSGLPLERVVQLDAKQFTMSDKRVWVGVQETVDPYLTAIELQRYRATLRTLKLELKVDYMVFVVVSILEQSSYVVVVDEPEASLVQRCFGGVLEENGHVLRTPSRVSRKLDFVPPLQACLSSWA